MLISPKIVAISTVQIFIISFMISYLEIELPTPSLESLRKWVESKFELSSQSIEKELVEEDQKKTQKKGAKNTVKTSPTKESGKVVLTSEELAKYTGEKGSKGLYLAVLGKIYDVQKGSKHYGPNGGYHFFAGKDGTRAFVTGEFKEEGLREDVVGLSHQDMLGIEEWMGFYEKEYKFVGFLEGTYYDSKGRPTAHHNKAVKALNVAHKWQATQTAETERYPPCNSEWSQGKGGRVWCSNKSGGINRDWAGVPRKLFKPGSSQSRCACVKNFGPPQDSDSAARSHNDKGDLENPNLQEYDNCDAEALSCNLPSND